MPVEICNDFVLWYLLFVHMVCILCLCVLCGEWKKHSVPGLVFSHLRRGIAGIFCNTQDQFAFWVKLSEINQSFCVKGEVVVANL